MTCAGHVRHHVNEPNDFVQGHGSAPEPPDQSKHPRSEGNAPSNSGLGFLSTIASSPTPDAGIPTHAFARRSNWTRRTSLAEVSLRTPATPCRWSIPQTMQQEFARIHQRRCELFGSNRFIEPRLASARIRNPQRRKSDIFRPWKYGSTEP